MDRDLRIDGVDAHVHFRVQVGGGTGWDGCLHNDGVSQTVKMGMVFCFSMVFLNQ